ncbi:MAG: CHASE3 domain-containing protein [Steroidobacteraceae bacterium]
MTHTHEVSNGLDLLLLAATEAETSQRGYPIGGDTAYLQSYERSREAAATALRTISTMPSRPFRSTPNRCWSPSRI